MRLGIKDRGIGGRGSVKDDPDSIRPWEIWVPSLPHGPLQAPPGYAGICEHRGGFWRHNEGLGYGTPSSANRPEGRGLDF